MRVYLIEKLSTEAALVSILRAWLSPENGVRAVVTRTAPPPPADAETLFYTNERVLGAPIGLPSQASIFRSLVPRGVTECPVTPGFKILAWPAVTSSQVAAKYAATLDSGLLKKFGAQVGRKLLGSMLRATLVRLPPEKLAEIHAAGVFSATAG